MGDPDETRLERIVVPLFPLPNVVLFPRAVLPLHIFEERYKEMTADALSSDRRVAMALLRPGWEKDYYSRPAIEPVVCVGTILEYERLADGKYNFLLMGQTRARLLREHKGGAYRVAELEPLDERQVMEIDLMNQRQRLIDIFNELPITPSLCCQFRRVLSGPMPTSDVADLIAFNFIEDMTVKQSLLEETDVRRRVARVIGEMERVRLSVEATHRRGHANPSLN